MKVDLTAMWQGVGDARDAKEISADMYNELKQNTLNIATRGRSGRLVVDYGELMTMFAAVSAGWGELARLWARLGVSLASGITVGSNEE